MLAGQGQAQPALPTVELRVGPAVLVAEVARSPEEIRRGLMFREQLGEGEGMLFVFERPHQAGFWMKDTGLQLSVAFVDADGVVAEIHDLRPYELNAVWASTDRIRFAIEVPRGWLGRQGVRPGHVVLAYGRRLGETFATR